MCKISSGLRARYCALLLGVAVLALVGTAPTPAAGQQSPSPQVSGSCAGSIGVTFNTATPVFSTEDVNLTLTLTSSVAGGATTNTESVPSLGVDLVPADLVSGPWVAAPSRPVIPSFGRPT